MAIHAPENNSGVDKVDQCNIRLLPVSDQKATNVAVSGPSENLFEGTFRQLVAVLAGSILAISDGMHVGWPAPAVPILLGPDSPVKATKLDMEWLELSMGLGGLAGLLLTVYFVDKIGRKKSILLSTFVSLLVWLTYAVAPRVEYMIVARGFVGAAGDMAFIAIPMYIAEIAQPKIRGLMISMVYLMMLFGILIIYTIAPYMPFYAHCICGAIIVLIELIIFPFMPESPYYLLDKNQPEAAEQSLRRLRPPGTDIDQELENIKAAIARQKTERGKPQDLFLVPSNRKAILIMTVMNFTQHFSSVSILLMNIHVILEAAGSVYVEPNIAAIIFSIIMLLAAIIATFSVDKYGRKTLLISSCLLTATCLLFIAIYFSFKNAMYQTAYISWIPIVCIMLLACCFKLGLGMVPIVLTGELFPTKMKAYGMTLADGIYVGSGVLALVVYQRFADSLGLQYAFYLFSCTCFLTAIFTYLYIPETKGKTLEEIQMILKGTLIAVSDGMQYGWSSPVSPILLGPNSPVKVTKFQMEWLEIWLGIGGFLALPITMYLVDKIGRKRSILLAAFLSLLIWITMAVAPSVEYIVVARTVSGGTADVVFVAIPMYIAEIAEPKIRGFLSSLIFLMMLFGILIIYTITPYIPFYAHCVFGAILVSIELIIFPFMPDSPYYLIYKNQPEAAEKSLRRLRSAGSDICEELENIKAAVIRQKSERGKIQDLFVVPSNRKAIIIMATLNFAQHFSSVSVFLMNMHDILEAAGSIYLPSDISAILFSVMMLLSAIIASFSIDRYGRKTLLIVSSISTGVCLLIIAVYFSFKNSTYDTTAVSWIPIVCVMLYACCFKLGLGMVPIVLTSELFPAKMKAYGITLADFLYVGSAILSLLMYQQLTDSFGLQYPFFVFSCTSFFTAIFTYFYIPETKAKTLEEIQLILKGKPSSE